MSSVETKALLKTTLILVIFLLIASGFGYVIYNMFREKPLDVPAPFVAEVKDADIQLLDDGEDAGLFLNNCAATPDTQEASDMLERVNIYRAQNGLGPLKLSPTLMKAAAWFADDLLANNARGHIDSLGRNPSERAVDCGYPTEAVAENSAGGMYADPLVYWQQSPGHNKNLLKANHTVMGYGIAGDRGEYRYVYISGVQDDSGSTIPPMPSPSPTKKITPTNTSPSPTPIRAVSPTPTPRMSPIPTGGQDVGTSLSTTFTFPGIGTSGNASPVDTTKQITIQVFDTDNNKVREGTVNATYSGGAYSAMGLQGIAPGRYYVKAKAINTLQENGNPEIITVAQNGSTSVSFQFISGDVTGDNILDIRDYNAFLPYYNKCNSSSPCPEQERVDFNSDGLVEGIDYNILLRSFQEVRGQ